MIRFGNRPGKNRESGREDREPGEEWFDFNYALETESTDSRLNEDFLVRRLNLLWNLPPADHRVFWLGLARLNELALLCAGNYADACEFSAAGDLLLNPRLILIHLKGKPDPVVKNRHQALTGQMAPMVSGDRNVIGWIKSNTRLEVRQYALLPHLSDLMARSGCLSEAYLHSVQTRCGRIAGAISFLTANRITGPAALCAALARMGGRQRAELKQGMCGFDRRIFSDLGREMHQIMRYGDIQSEYTTGKGIDPRELASLDLHQPAAYGPEKDEIEQSAGIMHG